MLLKAAIGMGFAAASLTAAGAAGALPGPAQHMVASTIAAVTPWTFPEKASDHADFGRTVSTDAHDGGVDGKVVSDAAKHKHDGDGTEDTATTDDTRQTGLDRAGETPAAGHVPTSLPGANADGSGSGPSATGEDRVGETPAADHHPEAPPTTVTTAKPTDTTSTEAPAPSGDGTHDGGSDHSPTTNSTSEGHN